MQSTIDTLMQNPLVTLVGLLLVIGLGLSLALKAVKVALVVMLAIAIYAAWLHFSGQDVPYELQQAQQKLEEVGETVRDKAEEFQSRDAGVDAGDVRSGDSSQADGATADGSEESRPN